MFLNLLLSLTSLFSPTCVFPPDFYPFLCFCFRTCFLGYTYLATWAVRDADRFMRDTQSNTHGPNVRFSFFVALGHELFEMEHATSEQIICFRDLQL